eukprot:COSAG06_NODE_60393_length_271_cov_0.593023_1_plen_50_part_10
MAREGYHQSIKQAIVVTMAINGVVRVVACVYHQVTTTTTTRTISHIGPQN